MFAAAGWSHRNLFPAAAEEIKQKAKAKMP